MKNPLSILQALHSFFYGGICSYTESCDARRRSASVLRCAAQQLRPQGDPAVPRPGEDADVSGIDRGVDDVLTVRVIVEISLEHLEGE